MADVVVQRADLREGLQVCWEVAKGKSAWPILNCFALSAHELGMSVRANDLECAVEYLCPVESASDELTAVLDASMLRRVLGCFRGDLVRLEDKSELRCWVDGGGAEILSGELPGFYRENARFELLGLPPDERAKWPLFEDKAAVMVKAPDLARGLRDALACVSCHEERALLTGVLFELDGDTVRLVGADGYRLGMAALTASVSTSDEPGTPMGFVVPARFLRMACSVLESPAYAESEACLGFGESMCRLSIGRWTLFGRMIEGTFPNWRRAVWDPNSVALRVTLDADDLRRAVTQVLEVHPDRRRLEVSLGGRNGGIHVQARNAGTGCAFRWVESEQEVLEEFEFAVNGDFLRDALGRLGPGKAVLSWPPAPEISPIGPKPNALGSIRMERESGAGPLFVLMPMQLD